MEAGLLFSCLQGGGEPDLYPCSNEEYLFVVPVWLAFFVLEMGHSTRHFLVLKLCMSARSST